MKTAQKGILSSLILTFSMLSQVANAQISILLRTPSISPDGQRIAFSFQGDIWTGNVNGGDLNRLTIHEAYEASPIWSPDGKQIAFTGNRYGNNDVYVVNAKGGVPKRITYHSSSDAITDWTSNGHLLFEGNRNFRQVEWDREIQKVSANGGTSERAMNAFGYEAVASPNGKFIAYSAGACRVAREQYKGSANKDIWVYNTATDTYHQITSFHGQDYQPVWVGDDQLFFISARSGNYNIHKAMIDEDGAVLGTVKQVTKTMQDEMRSFSLNDKGNVGVVAMDTKIYKLDVSTGVLDPIQISIAADYRFDPYEMKTYTNSLEGYSISPNGKYASFIVHGDVFVSENDKKKSLTKNLTNSSSREKDVTWLNDSTVIFSSDKNGQYDLFMVNSGDKNEGDLLRTLKYSTTQLTEDGLDERRAQVSPDAQQMVYIKGGNFGNKELIVVDINEKGKFSKSRVLQKGWSDKDGVAWSPDSKWLAFTMEDLNFNAEVYVQSASGVGDAINVSMHPRGDYSPVWSRDCSKLGFVSARNNSDNDIWFVWLKKEDYQRSKEDWDALEDADKDTVVTIDIEDIHERLVQLTSLPGNEGSLQISEDGKTFYFTSSAPGDKGQDLYSVSWEGKDIKQVTKGGKSPYNLELGPDGKYIYFAGRSGLSRIKLAGGEVESLPYKAKMKIDHTAELEQVFEEAWRGLRDGFYDPEFHGQNWDKLKDQYKPYCMAASTKTDFYHMFNNMLGQLNASHMGIRGSDREETQKESTGLLGVEIKPLKDGVRIVRVIPNSPADRASSKLNAGDVINSVNGEEVKGGVNFWSMLNGTAGSEVLLEVKNTKGDRRDVVIRPTSSLSNELYDEWVKSNRKLVDEYSKGRLGYLHIRGMNMPSFERFERELTAAGHGKDAIVIDVRFNGGGWTTDYLMAVLNVKQHAYTIPRGATNSLDNHKDFRNYYPFAERLPFYAWNKPSIALCNANSYSNAEIFSHAYKNLGIGTLVGRPSFGAVISTSGLGLMDGSMVRMPFRAWYAKADNKNMEIDPAVPNIQLDVSQDAKFKNVDEQLKRATDELIKQIDMK